MTTRTVLLCGIFLSISSEAQQPDSASAADKTNGRCAQKLQIPTYPAIARQAQFTGTLSVKVTLDDNASVARISAQSHLNHAKAEAVFLMPIENAIRKSQFYRDCAGRTVTLEYEFQITGRPSETASTEVQFGWPNHFWINTSPSLAHY